MNHRIFSGPFVLPPKTFLILWTKKLASAPLHSFTAAFLTFLRIRNARYWERGRLWKWPVGLRGLFHPPSMGSLPIMAIFGDHKGQACDSHGCNDALPSSSSSGCVLHPVGDFLRYLISGEAGNLQFSVNAATSFLSFKLLRRQRAQTGKQRGKARPRTFSRFAGKCTADVHGGQKRSQKCGSDQQEHVPQIVFVAAHGPGLVMQAGFFDTSVNTHVVHARTLPACASGLHF